MRSNCFQGEYTYLKSVWIVTFPYSVLNGSQLADIFAAKQNVITDLPLSLWRFKTDVEMEIDKEHKSGGRSVSYKHPILTTTELTVNHLLLNTKSSFHKIWQPIDNFRVGSQPSDLHALKRIIRVGKKEQHKKMNDVFTSCNRTIVGTFVIFQGSWR